MEPHGKEMQATAATRNVTSNDELDF